MHLSQLAQIAFTGHSDHIRCNLWSNKYINFIVNFLRLIYTSL
jgi:hypothetical protein